MKHKPAPLGTGPKADTGDKGKETMTLDTKAKLTAFVQAMSQRKDGMVAIERNGPAVPGSQNQDQYIRTLMVGNGYFNGCLLTVAKASAPDNSILMQDYPVEEAIEKFLSDEVPTGK